MSSLVMVTLSVSASVAISLAMDVTLVVLAPSAPAEVLAAILFNGTCILILWLRSRNDFRTKEA